MVLVVDANYQDRWEYENIRVYHGDETGLTQYEMESWEAGAEDQNYQFHPRGPNDIAAWVTIYVKDSNPSQLVYETEPDWTYHELTRWDPTENPL